MGSILTLVENHMFRQLWDQDFRVIACAASWAEQPAWIHDCFLDAIGSGIVVRKAANSFILNPSYELILTEEQWVLKRALAPLAALMHDERITSSRSWTRIGELLREFGAVGIDNDEIYS